VPGFRQAGGAGPVHDRGDLFPGLTAGRRLAPGAPLPLADLIHPRVEPEIVFVLGDRLSGPAVTAGSALRAVPSPRGVARGSARGSHGWGPCWWRRADASEEKHAGYPERELFSGRSINSTSI